jgi:hypothetical protein
MTHRAPGGVAPPVPAGAPSRPPFRRGSGAEDSAQSIRGHGRLSPANNAKDEGE